MIFPVSDWISIAVVFAAAAQPPFLRQVFGLIVRWRGAGRRRRLLSPDRQALACLAGLVAGVTLGSRPTITTLGLGLLLSQLIMLDCRYLWLPRRLTLPLLAAGLLAGASDAAALAESAIGTAAGFAAFAALRWTFRIWRGQEGLGAGDVTLFAGIGAWVGLDLLAPIALIAAVLALAGVVLIDKGRRDRAIPFGAWLCVAFWVVWIGEGPDIASAWLAPG